MLTGPEQPAPKGGHRFPPLHQGREMGKSTPSSATGGGAAARVTAGTAQHRWGQTGCGKGPLWLGKEPTDPTEPIDPIEPSDPSEPTDSSEPTELIEPSDPIQPSDPTDPTDPTDSTYPSDPIEPTDRSTSLHPLMLTHASQHSGSCGDGRVRPDELCALLQPLRPQSAR